MYTIKLIAILLVGLLIAAPPVILMIGKQRAKMNRYSMDMLYWAVDCTIYNGHCWIDKQLTLAMDPYENEQVKFMAEALVEQYMEAMLYPKGEYTITLVSRISEDEYRTIRKDLFVSLHGHN